MLPTWKFRISLEHGVCQHLKLIPDSRINKLAIVEDHMKILQHDLLIVHTKINKK